MRVIVLGAGLIGTASAYYLQSLGHEVTVVDRQAAPGAETSFANGGQISVSHAEPWANPGAPLKLLAWLGRADAPLLFRPRADVRQWLWGLSFLRNCTPSRTRHHIAQIVRLGTYSRTALQQLRADTGIQYEQRTQGILHFYTSAREFEAALRPTEHMQALGCDRRLIDADEAVRLEPALAGVRDRIAGATYTAEDESGDAQLFTRALARIAAHTGVQFRLGHHITALRTTGAGASEHIDHVELTNADGRYERLRGDAYVLALGSFSPLLVQPLGLRLPIYPAKGYSVTLPVLDPARAYQVSLTDDEFKLVFSRYTGPQGDRLRIAGTAEFNGYDRRLDPVRCEAIVRRVQQLFPGAGDTEAAQYWSGLRPATPSNVPLIGRSRIANLFLNTGHGTLGWTHACGSGKALADLVSGRQPAVDFDFLGQERAGTGRPGTAPRAHASPTGAQRLRP
ncbi:MAG: D-amino acid dehydrogenase [Burkholderiaceae bacterium]|jgi:D-amino-acid dehydrogenase|nr:D-amino acid dehydrogenase [Burkholderiaceae bacterium]